MTRKETPWCAVIGAGVTGLSSAVELAERGIGVRVIFDPRREGQASWVAPALFTPYSGNDAGRFRRWTETAAAAWRKLARESPESGVRLGELREYNYRPLHVEPWMIEVLAMRPLAAPSPCVSATTSIRPHVDMLRYMPWLEARARALGVEFVPRRLDSVDQAFASGVRVVMNCSGVGARRLAADSLVKPMHGQVLHVPNDIDLPYSVHDDAPGGLVAYVFVFDDRLVLGGTFDAGREDAATDRGALDAILDRCRGLLRLDGFPRWSDLGRRELRVLAGIRPTRGPEGAFEHLRLEAEVTSDGRTIVHHYGHGRAGVTLSWGTARAAADLVCEALDRGAPGILPLPGDSSPTIGT